MSLLQAFCGSVATLRTLKMLSYWFLSEGHDPLRGRLFHQYLLPDICIMISNGSNITVMKQQ